MFRPFELLSQFSGATIYLVSIIRAKIQLQFSILFSICFILILILSFPIMSQYREQALHQLLMHPSLVCYVKHMKELKDCYGPVLETDSSMPPVLVCIHFIVCSKESYDKAYLLRQEHVMPDHLGLSRQVTLKKDIVGAAFSDEYLVMIVNQICDGFLDTLSIADQKESSHLFFSYQSKASNIYLTSNDIKQL